MAEATPQAMREALASLISEVDLSVLEGPLGEWFAATTPLAFAGGVSGWVDDDLAFLAPFGFELSSIAVPVLIVHGRHDRFVPVSHGEWLAGAIPGAEAWISDSDGHLTLTAQRLPDVHSWLLSDH